MKITAIETIQLGPDSAMPSLLLVRVHTDAGPTGLGDTFYLPEACAAVIHTDIAPALLGADPLAVERHWRHLHDGYARYGGRGAELRALSAVDVALWDVLGKTAGLPVYRLLGAAHDRVRTYNTCGGPRYASVQGGSRAGYGSAELAGTLDDFDAFLNRPGELARELLAEGLTGMKIWPFDRFAQARGGHRIDRDDLAEGVRIVAEIRAAVGDAMDVMVDGHGLWQLDPAIRIAKALEPYDLAWVEDLTLADKPHLLARLRAATTVPVSVSEYLVTRAEYLPVLQAEAADVVMIDPTWAGGITESRKIAALADTYGLGVTYHDCTGPLTLLAGVHLALATPNVRYQETVRAYLRTVYPELVTTGVEVVDGHVLAPTAPGLGTELQPGLTTRPGVTTRVSGTVPAARP